VLYIVDIEDQSRARNRYDLYIGEGRKREQSALEQKGFWSGGNMNRALNCRRESRLGRRGEKKEKK
jgi:hypothetical protein